MKNRPSPSKSDSAAARVIRDARMQAKLSQEALAELAGLHRTYISLLERNRRSPTLSTLELIGNALGMPPAKLIRQIADASSESVEDSGPVLSKEASTLEPRSVTNPNADQ